MTATKKTKKNSRATLSHALSPADMPNPWCFRAETALQVGAWKAKYFFESAAGFQGFMPTTDLSTIAIHRDGPKAALIRTSV